ncbi:glycosyl hydrolase family 61-domain-containing protein [Massariosphaeria phaeospora]|uniref:lytic cellulose monooxygenase (C4-dehydrogenating) n=1 Tax=Massariosphaeria phaeospora TaxID=100035 RepID=A0A7C8I662_9PLEO|nr:glycosyl hydrolase family 61-domain-containing protein [Massariosphaeria phaeospora]
MSKALANCERNIKMGPVNLIVHEGPVMMHLSRAPAGQDLRTYDGSGEWVKIYTLGIEIRKELANPVFWLPHNDGKEAPRFISTIPKQTPAGKYLVRVDQVYYGNSQYNTAPQLFPACAQIEVVSDTTGDLPKGIKIPENLQMDQPGMTSKYEDLPNKYTYPGGPLWDGETLVQDYPPHWDR